MLKVTSNEKAALGGLVTALVTLIVQLQQSGQLTGKEVLYSLGAWVFTHAAVWLTTNTPKPPSALPTV